ncbi:hypothetical protein GBA52_023899 [Prunus armeniaca]|nr:hypothetical protein GBA52_023899 [Prunus armeniaca]
MVNKENKFKRKESDPPTTIPIFPHNFGAYTISLGFGNPKQTIPLTFDTGSSLVWAPRTSQYTCSNCSLPNINLEKSPIFYPDRSFKKPMHCEAQIC